MPTMSKQWFLIESMGVTLDLSLVTHVSWNDKTPQNVYTEIQLGTSAAYDPDSADIAGDRWWIHHPEDRKKLQSALVALGLPTVELVFSRKETIDDYAGEDILDRYIDPEELNTDR